MQQDTLMKEIPESEFLPRTSVYLAGGYKDESFKFKKVLLGNNTIQGFMDFHSHFADSSGKFHLSGSSAMIGLFQLGAIYTCCDIGWQEKTKEFYVRDFQIKFVNRVVKLTDIFIELKITKKTVKKGMVYYRCNCNIESGSFLGTMSWFVYVDN